MDLDGFDGASENVFISMRKQNDRFFRVINDAVCQARLIVEDERDAVFAGNVFGGYDDEFGPVDFRGEGDFADGAARGFAADGSAVQHAGEAHVVNVEGGSGDFVAALFAWDVGADDVALGKLRQTGSLPADSDATRIASGSERDGPIRYARRFDSQF